MCVYMVPKGYAETSIKDDKYDIYFNNSEILNSNLDNVVLKILSLGFNSF